MSLWRRVIIVVMSFWRPWSLLLRAHCCLRTVCRVCEGIASNGGILCRRHDEIRVVTNLSADNLTSQEVRGVRRRGERRVSLKPLAGYSGRSTCEGNVGELTTARDWAVANSVERGWKPPLLSPTEARPRLVGS